MTRPAGENALAFEAISFARNGRTVLERVGFGVPAGQITALMGPSGCGKSSLVALAAGLLIPASGRVRRSFQRAGLVFQDLRLLPWRTALDNVAFALKADRLPAREREERARRILISLGLSEADLGKYPRQLSGGMCQRVALARALVIEPDLLLLDEPFAALDRSLAQQMQLRVRDFVRSRGASALMVTHAAGEGMLIADRIVELSPAPGRVIGERETAEDVTPASSV